jgi:prepilin-type N-terminal cleavage/methylation domain-containing protein
MSGIGNHQACSRKGKLARRGRSPAIPPQGYSLLELMIVLVVLVGLLALAWPSLSRPLTNSDLQQAAIHLRTHLATARLSAMQSGEPVLVRIEHGSGILTYASWHQTMMPVSVSDLETEFEAADTESVDRSDDVEAPSESKVGDSWELPQGIVVDAVSHGDARAPQSESPMLLDGELDMTSPAATLSESNPSVEMDSLEEESMSTAFKTSWVWFLPQGQASGAKIRLIDTRAQLELTLKIQSWNGAITIEKPRAILLDDEGMGLEIDGLESREDAFDDRKSGSYGGEDSTLDAF